MEAEKQREAEAEVRQREAVSRAIGVECLEQANSSKWGKEESV